MGDWRYNNSFLSWALDGSAKLHAAAASPLEKDIPGTHCIGGCLLLRSGLDNLDESLFTAGNRTTVSRTSSLWPSRYTNCAIPGFPSKDSRVMLSML